ncbi:MAG: TIGR03862 family flavoprotein [Marinobacter sp.]|uniref:TIGR03862 family flavoprotein n=1 Tax=Marinobacter sp. TaxID=50741 RepID=UPI0034A08337
MIESLSSPVIAVVGAGPAGLLAAEVIARAGYPVAVFDAKPSVGRKLLRAGIGGLNLTHAEPLPSFVTRYGERTGQVAPMLDRFGPAQLVEWVQGLGIETFVGSSQRVFPGDKKAAPFLRAWLKRLRGLGVEFHMRWRWLGWQDGALQFDTPDGVQCVHPRATVLALGGASWPELGSDGKWVSALEQQGLRVAPLKPSNCGFQVSWSDHFRERFVRQPVKSVRAALSLEDSDQQDWHSGELMVTGDGLEGGLLYALSAVAREQVAQYGHATVLLDLNPGRTEAQLVERLSQPQGRRSLAKHLKSKAGIDGVKAGLLREFCANSVMNDPNQLARHIKRLPVPLGQPFAVDRAISSAGGVRFEDLTDDLMLNRLTGVFCAGEMLDWEAPTGGYLLTGCFASGWVAGTGVVTFLQASD